MVQIQTDHFVRLLTSISDDMARMFPPKATPLQIKWALDTTVQQGRKHFPREGDIYRVRNESKQIASDEKRRHALAAIVHWYSGLCETIDQGGIRWDCSLNQNLWHSKIQAGGITQEQFDLFYLSFLTSRTSAGMGGYWQALTFERRATIVLASKRE